MHSIGIFAAGGSTSECAPDTSEYRFLVLPAKVRINRRAGPMFLGAYKDGDGEWFDGANAYRLRMSANAPVKQFWSLTVYNVDTRCLIRNPRQVADRSKRDERRR